MRRRLGPAALFCFLLACGGDDEASVDPVFESAGPFAVGNTTVSITDSSRVRTLTVEIWYPQVGAESQGQAVEEFLSGENKASYEALLTAAPSDCPSIKTQSDRDATPTDATPLPLLVFSHCHNCVRFSSFAIAERLASHGFVVAAPDHTGNTLFDDLASEGADLNSEFLQVRAADISFVIDSMLAGQANLVVDPDKIGVYGHSFGAVTTGLVLQEDPRPIAGFAIASPMENPLLTGVELEKIVDPVGFLVAVEDNSITEFGNIFIRQNFDDVTGPAWKGEVSDAGHWSFSDICGVHSQFEACCGTGTRQTDGQPFTYLPVEQGIAVAQAYVTAFFMAHIQGDANAKRYLGENRFPDILDIQEHGAEPGTSSRLH